ncbi:hypothetical protein LCGC14_2555180, partial [marine sediment metagenome]
ITYRNLKCKDPNCPKFGQEFPSKLSLAQHNRFHNPKSYKHHTKETKKKMSDSHKGKKCSEETKRKISESYNRPKVREKYSNAMKEKWRNPEFRERMTGENHPKGRLGKFGKESSEWKGDNVGYGAIHKRVQKRKIKPKNCEICGEPEFYDNNHGRLELSDKTGLCIDDNNNFQYVHQSCHKKYDIDNNIVHIKSPK